MLQRESSGTLRNTSDDEIARHNGNQIYGCTRRHPKKFQIALGIISPIKSNDGRLYFDSLSADRLTLTKTHCAAMDLHASRHGIYVKKEDPGDYTVTEKGEFKLGRHFEPLCGQHKMFLQSATV